jgi:predicted DNA-binding transcriptional regulator AlpA
MSRRTRPSDPSGPRPPRPWYADPTDLARQIRPAEASRLAGVSERTLDRWSRAGLFPRKIRRGRLAFYTLGDVLAFIEQNIVRQ